MNMNSATSVTVKSSGKDLSRRKRKKDRSVDFEVSCTTVKPVLSGHSQNTKMGLQDQLSLNACQKYCRMLQGEHSAILSTCIQLPHGFKTFVLSIFEWPLKTGFTVLHVGACSMHLIYLPQRFFFKKREWDIVIASVRLSVRLSVMLSPP